MSSARTHLDHVWAKPVLVTDSVHVFLQIQVEKLEHEKELRIRMHNVEQSVVSARFDFMSRRKKRPLT